MRAGRFLIATFALIAIVGCNKEKKADQASDTGATTATDFKVENSIKLDGQPVTVAGVTFTPPSTWKSLGASGMRQASFTYGPTQGESDSATMIVFYFGQSGGGDVNANIERWIGQMAGAEGADAHQSAKQQHFTVDGMNAHWVDVVGTYNAAMGGGGMPGSATEAKANYRLAGVVLEGPQGNLFFKLTGPEKTASEMVEGFRAMIAGAKKAV